MSSRPTLYRLRLCVVLRLRVLRRLVVRSPFRVTMGCLHPLELGIGMCIILLAGGSIEMDPSCLDEALVVGDQRFVF
jgi:hypothetical protein